MDANISSVCFLFYLSFLQGIPFAIQTKFLPIIMRNKGASLRSVSYLRLLDMPAVFKVFFAPIISSYGTMKGWLLSAYIYMTLTFYILSVIDIGNIPLLFLVLLLQSVSTIFKNGATEMAALELTAEKDAKLAGVSGTVGKKIGGAIGSKLTEVLKTFAFLQLGVYFKPAIGGLFILVYKVLGLRMAFLVVALLYVLGVAMVLLYPTTRSPRSAQKQSDSNSYSATFIDAFRVPSTWWMALYMLIYKSGENSSMMLVPLFLVDVGVDDSLVAVISGVLGSWIVIAGSASSTMLHNRYSLHRTSCILNRMRAVLQIPITAMILAIKLGYNDNLFICALTALYFMQLFLCGISTAVTASWHMYLSGAAPHHLRSTHYSILATCEKVGRLLFVSSSGLLADWLGYSSVFVILIFISLFISVITNYAPVSVDTEKKSE